MRKWEGIKRDTDATAPGADMAVNTRHYYDGEMRRRLALQSVAVANVRNGIASYGAPNGGQYYAFVDATGDLEMVVA